MAIASSSDSPITRAPPRRGRLQPVGEERPAGGGDDQVLAVDQRAVAIEHDQSGHAIGGSKSASRAPGRSGSGSKPSQRKPARNGRAERRAERQARRRPGAAGGSRGRAASALGRARGWAAAPPYLPSPRIGVPTARMGAQLMGAAVQRLQREPARDLAGAGDHAIARRAGPPSPRASTRSPARPACLASGRSIRPSARRSPDHQRPVELVDPMAAERPVSLAAARARPGDHQEPARVAVEAVHEARPLAAAASAASMPSSAAGSRCRPGPRARPACRARGARRPRAGCGSAASRRRPARRPAPRGAARRLGSLGERRDADALAGAQARFGVRPPAIDPDLAGAQQLLQPAVAELGEMPAEPAIEAELGLVGSDRAHLDRAHRPLRARAAASPSARASAGARPRALLGRPVEGRPRHPVREVVLAGEPLRRSWS